MGIIATLSQAAPLSVFKFLSPSQILDVKLRTEGLDLTAALQAAIDSGEALYWPAGTYRHDAPLVLRPTSPNLWRGEGELTLLKAGAAMTAQVKKPTQSEGGDWSPVTIRDMYFDANRFADWCVRVPICLQGKFTSLKMRNFLVGGFAGGDPAGGTTAKFYESRIDSLDIRGAISEAALNGFADNIPQYGIYLYQDATDNYLIDITPAFITEAGVTVTGGYNTIQHVHAWGPGSGSRRLKYGVVVKSGAIIGTVYADHCSVAGVFLDPDSGANPNITISVLDSMHLATAVPTAGTYVPLLLGDNVNSSNVSVGMISARNTNTADPIWKYTGAWRPTNFAVGMIVGTGFTMPTNETQGFVHRSFAVRGNGAYPAFFLANTDLATQRAAIRFSVGNTLRWDIGTNGVSESGSNAGSELEVGFTNDSNARSVVFGAKRTNGGEPYMRGRAWIGTSYAGDGSGRVGFYDTTPVAKPTGTPAAATDAATTQALVNDLRTKLITLGLIG